MKRIILLLIISLLLLSACGKKNNEVSPLDTPAPVATPESDVLEVRITLQNLYDYFEYHEFRSCVKGGNGEINSLQIAYGLKLKPQYTAANLPAKQDTLKLVFTADAVINKGQYVVNYSTLDYSGATDSTEHETVTQELIFWPKGDRTSIWTFGNYSSTYIMYFENFTVTSASGTIYIKQVAAD